MHSPTRSFRRSPVGIGLTIFATITLILSLAAMVRPNPAFAQDEGGQGTAQCPAGTTFLANIEINGEGNIDGSFDGLTFELVDDGKGLEVTNTTEDQTFTIVVKGGSDKNGGGDGDAVEIGPGETDTVTARINDNNGTPFGVSNFSICGTEDGGEEEGEDLVLIKQDLEAGSLSGVGFTLGDGDEILTVEGQITFSDLTEGSLTLTETSNPDENCETGGTLTVEVSAEGTITVTDDDETDGLAIVSFDATTNTLVLSNDCEEDGEEEMVSVSIMKHLCDDVTTVAEFEAVENAGAGGQAGGIGTVPGLVATVLACPTIVLTGDVPTSGAITNGNVDFDFSVIDADGTQRLSSDGTFEQEALCEDDVMVDADDSGTIDANVCLDTSHYMFEVVDGTVVITETEDPEGSTGLGTIRFTPGSEDDTALSTSIDVVEATGVITLDTSMASETALSDGMIMIHAYNFAEGEGGVNPGTGGNGPTGEGTLGGNPGGSGALPNTATSPVTESLPAALLAILVIAGLGWTARVNLAAVRARMR